MTAGSAAPARVALVGAHGHGQWHRRHLAQLAARGVAELVAIADPVPVPDVPPGVLFFDDHQALLDAVPTDVVVVCTPPHTHADIASDALRAGHDVLLEKPPVLDLAEHAALSATAVETGRAIQVGFQALASPALARLREAIDAGHLGQLRGVSVVSAWQRDDQYWSRSPWSGRRTMNGKPTLDGALVNPFAHAVMQALAVLAATPARVEVAWCRVRPIEVEDTATLRVTTVDGTVALLAVTLAGEDHVDGALVAYGLAGHAELAFRADRLRLPGDRHSNVIHGRVSLLQNLIEHRRRGAPLLAPLAVTAGFTAVAEALRGMPEPALIGPDWLTSHDGLRTLCGVNKVLRRCADDFLLLTELPVPWPATAGVGAANRHE